MSELIPHDVPPPSTAPDDPRVGHLLARGLAPTEAPLAALIGFPTDVGVRRNGGRAGAAAAPRAIREALYRMTPDAERPGPLAELLTRTRDLGDVAVGEDLAHDQIALGEAIAPHLERGTFVVVLGGGHETAYGHFLGYAWRNRRVRILNWDAHADVRTLAAGQGHSGSPFRQALEHPSGACAEYVVAGLQAHAAASAHVEYIVAKGGRCHWRGEITPGRVAAVYEGQGARMVSFDLDAVDQAFAPGVSAPASNGLTVEQWLDAAERAGRAPGVTSADVVELNPSLDPDGRTRRLAALTVWRILRGLALRPTT